MWRSVSAGLAHTLAIKNDGSLWVWGYNEYGQLGLGDTINRKQAFRLGTDTNWIAVAAGGVHSLALKSDGSLWAMGGNYMGQLGDSSNVSSNQPVQVGSDKQWKHISAGYEYSVALCNNNTLWSWGFNGNGQLGQGGTTTVHYPAQIGNDSDWEKISAGASFSFAIKTDSSLYAWGYNGMGQLGTNTTTQHNSPVRIGMENNWSEVAAAAGVNYSGNLLGLHSLGLKESSQEICATGANYVGQLGDNTTINKQSFKCATAVDVGILEDFVQIPGTYVYPNPTTGLVTLRFNQLPTENAEIEVYNILGKQMQSLVSGEEIIDIDLSAYPKGVYFIHISGNGFSWSEKVVVVD
jgi:alpha-tubulin suppressor-like RCC1 family protein